MSDALSRGSFHVPSRFLLRLRCGLTLCPSPAFGRGRRLSQSVVRRARAQPCTGLGEGDRTPTPAAARMASANSQTHLTGRKAELEYGRLDSHISDPLQARGDGSRPSYLGRVPVC